MQMVRGNGRNQFRQYVGRNVGNQGVQNLNVQNVGNQNGVIVVLGIASQNGNDNVVVVQAKSNANGNNDLDEIEEVNANCISMANLQQASTSGTQTNKTPFYDSDGSAEQASTSGTQTNKAPVYDSDGSAEVFSVEQDGGTVNQHPATVEETRAYFESLYNNLAIEVEKVNSINRKMKETNAALTTELARYKNQEKCFEISQEKYNKLERCYQRGNTKNDRVPSASNSSCSKNKEVEVEEHPKNLPLFKNKKHMSSECNNVKLAIQNDKSEVVCAMCKQCLITAKHDVCVLNYVNDMNSHGKKQKANASNTKNQKKQNPMGMKPKKVGSNKILASPKPSKPRSYLRWSPTGRLFDLKGKIITSSESESQSDCSNSDNACNANPPEPTIIRFPNSTSFLGRLSKFVYGASTRVVLSI
nr:hypothetical protein [Tanacetum cinerariifolium]